jgi:lipid II:glycine glycyltransferase (peptidoglycan interpeptide bridge formation enzyme)
LHAAGWQTSVEMSSTVEEARWDSFLESTNLGHFQQSCLWAQVKRLEGWRAIRSVCIAEDRPVGGFQILFRSSGGVRIGYVSKGPVLLPDYSPFADLVLHRLLDTVREHRIRALILQPPDVCTAFPPKLASAPFLPNRLVGIIQANCEVRLEGGFDEVERRMRPHTRQEVRQAARRNVVVREGRSEDLDAFFNLMLASCARQGDAHPNPSRVELLMALWRQFHPKGHVRLDLAEVQGKPVSGLLSIAFGSRVTFWKKGWSGEQAGSHPNQRMQYEALRWAALQGFKTCDFAAMRPDLARTLMEGHLPTETQKKSRDFFNLGFGGVPVLLPEARVYIPNPILRMAYRMWMSLSHRG